MKRTLILAFVVLLAGCSTISDGLSGKLDNRVTCSVARDKAFFVSEYGPVGIAATIAKQDASVLCSARDTAPAATK